MKTVLRFIVIALSVTVFGVMLAPVDSDSWVTVPIDGTVTTAAAAAAGRGDEQLALTAYLAKKYRQSLNMTHRIVKAAYKEGASAGVPPLLLLAMVEKESSLRPEVQNSYGAVGLMQVVPRFHPEKLADASNPIELHVPEVNIRVGSRILAESLVRKNGNLEKALLQYSGNATRYPEKVAQFQAELEKVLDKARQQEFARRGA